MLLILSLKKKNTVKVDFHFSFCFLSWSVNLTLAVCLLSGCGGDQTQIQGAESQAEPAAGAPGERAPERDPWW